MEPLNRKLNSEKGIPLPLYICDKCDELYIKANFVCDCWRGDLPYPAWEVA